MKIVFCFLLCDCSPQWSVYFFFCFTCKMSLASFIVRYFMLILLSLQLHAVGQLRNRLETQSTLLWDSVSTWITEYCIWILSRLAIIDWKLVPLLKEILHNCALYLDGFPHLISISPWLWVVILRVRRGRMVFISRNFGSRWGFFMLWYFLKYFSSSIFFPKNGVQFPLALP